MVMMYRIAYSLIDISATSLLHSATLSTQGNSMRYLQPFCRTHAYWCSFFPSGIRLLNQLPECVVTAATLETFKGGLPGHCSIQLRNVLIRFLNRFYQFLTMPQMHLVNIQCDNAPERALHLTGEEENSLE